MARENQGLHAALIVFVVLTILLAVSTFVFFSQYRSADERATKYQGDYDAAKQQATDKDKRLNNLREKVGFPTDTPEDIEDQFNKDMDKYGIEPDNRKYRTALEAKHEEVNKTHERHELDVEKLKKIEADLAAVNQLADQKIAQFEARAEEAEKERKREAIEFEKDRASLESTQKQLEEDLKQLKTDYEELLNTKDGQIAKLKTDLNVMTVAYESVKGTVDKMRQEIPDQFHGEIELVSQGGKTVWIDRGRADNLRPQTKFSVFPANATNIAEVQKKASIEVTRVHKGHLAEARIVEDDPIDPILVGDKIYTPVWSVGEKRHFALVGMIDLNGDGRNDLERMHTLIEVNGGVVDARLDEDGRRRGKMTMNTRYLILGKELDANSPTELRDDYIKMTNEAERLRIETITLEKFLEMMGWVPQVKLARFGSAGFDEFPVERNPMPAVSHGKMSELFKPRKPPRSSKSSPY